MSTPPFDPNLNPKAQAKAAKAYAKATRPWFKKKRFVIPIAIVALSVVGSALGGAEDEPSTTAASVTDKVDTAAAADGADAAAVADEPSSEPTATTKATPKAKKKAKPVKVEAASMLKEFEDNELAGDKKYKGKNIQVSGTIDKIDTELLDSDQYVLRISDGSEFAFLTVNCNDMSEDELSTLTVGEEVTAVGKFEDGGDLGVELEKCKLV